MMTRKMRLISIGSRLLKKIRKAPGIAQVLFVFLALLVTADKAFSIEKNFLVLCKRDKLVRTLKIEVIPGGRCRAVYAKEGKDQVIGSNSEAGLCLEYINGVRKTLETAHWICKEVKESTQSPLDSEAPKNSPSTSNSSNTDKGN